MATANDLVTGALRRLRVIAPDETPTALNAAYVLSELNDLMASKRIGGADTQWGTRDLGETVPLELEHIKGVKAMLAVQIAEQYGKSVGPVLAKDAVDGLADLQNDYGIIRDMKLDSALLNMPSQRRRYA